MRVMVIIIRRTKPLRWSLQLLQEELQGSVHALSLTTRTPDEEATELSKGNV